jgi:8-amino-7-oxononanoate synthase
VFGAFAAGDATAIEMLVQRARAYIYTTATPPLLAVALMKSLDLIRDGEARRQRLQQLVALLRDRLQPGCWPRSNDPLRSPELPGRDGTGRRTLERGWQLAPSSTPIQPLLIGAAGEAVAVAEALGRAGFLVPAIRPPTVPRGTARLRISLSAAHEPADVERLAAALQGLQ